MIIALQLLKSELSTHGTPLPEAFRVVAAAIKGSASLYFMTAAKTMNNRYWQTPSEVLRTAEVHLKELEHDDSVKEILRDFSAGLGKFDLQTQLQSIEGAITRLDFVYRAIEQEKNVRCRTYRMLGLCAGIALAIILI